MARSDSEEFYQSSIVMGVTKMVEAMEGRESSETLNDTTIHSGQFMVSCVHDREVDDEDEASDGSDNVIGRPVEVHDRGYDFQNASHEPQKSYHFGDNSSPFDKCKYAIDSSLSKLFECMTLAYSGKLTSPKWKNFKGIKLKLKEKIRLNNIIWREWHMQFIHGQKPIVCHFDPPISDKTHAKPEAVVLEGKYWKRRLESVTTEYKKWRLFFRNHQGIDLRDEMLMQESKSLETLLQQVADSYTQRAPWRLASTRLPSSLLDPLQNDEDDVMDFSDTLFTTLNQQNFTFPSPREMSGLGNADIMQPGLVQLQPNFDDFMDTIDVADMLSSTMPRGDQASTSVFGMSSSSGMPSLSSSSMSQFNTTPANMLPGSSSNMTLDQPVDLNSTIGTGLFGESPSLLDVAKSESPALPEPVLMSQSPQPPQVMSASVAIVPTQLQASSQAQQQAQSQNLNLQTSQIIRLILQQHQQQQQQQQQQQGLFQFGQAQPTQLAQQATATQSTPLPQHPAHIQQSRLPQAHLQAAQLQPTQLQQQLQPTQIQDSQLQQTQTLQTQLQQTQLQQTQLQQAQLQQNQFQQAQIQSQLQQAQFRQVQLQQAPLQSSQLQPTQLQQTHLQQSQIQQPQLQQLPIQQQPLLGKPHTVQLASVGPVIGQTQPMVKQPAVINTPQTVIIQNSSQLHTLLQSLQGSQVPTGLPVQSMSDPSFLHYNQAGVTGQHPVENIDSSKDGNRRASTGSVNSLLRSARPKKEGDFLVPQKPVRSKPRHLAPAPPGGKPSPGNSPIVQQNTYLAQLLTGKYPSAAPASVKREDQPKPASTMALGHRSATTSTYMTLQPATITTVTAPTKQHTYPSSTVTTSDLKKGILITPSGPVPSAISENVISASPGSPSQHGNSAPGSPASPGNMSASSPSYSVPSPGSDSANSPGKPYRVKADGERHVYRENRRVSHITAEQKRRYNIKEGFDTLHHLVPSLKCNPNAKISKAATLSKTAEFCRKLKEERAVRQQQTEMLKKEIEALNSAISLCQQQLPATGAPVTRQRADQMREMFDDYVRTRTLQNWKFWIFSIIIRPLFESYNNMVSTASVDDLCRTVLAWLEQHCSLVVLRPGVLSSLCHLSTTTSILSDPDQVAEQAKRAVLKKSPSTDSS